MNVFLPYHCFMKQLKVIKQHFFSLTQLNFWKQALAEAEGTYGSSRDWFRAYRGPVPNSSFSTVKRTTQYRGPSLVWNGTNQAKEQVSYRTAVLRTARAVKRTHSMYSVCVFKSLLFLYNVIGKGLQRRQNLVLTLFFLIYLVPLVPWKEHIHLQYIIA